MIFALWILTTVVMTTFALVLKTNPSQGSLYSPDYDGNPFNQIIYDDPLLFDHANINDLMDHVRNLWTVEILNSPDFNGMSWRGE